MIRPSGVLKWARDVKARRHCAKHGHQPVPENRLVVRCVRCRSWWG